jgi:hypothetical protein
MRDARHDPGQRGSAMLLVATLLVALLAGGAVALYVQLQGTKSASLVKASKSSLFCAEAGVIAARPTLAQSYLNWPILLDGNAANDPSWYPLTGDIDGDGVNDYEVTIKDNDDEVPPAADDPEVDTDRRVFAVGRCLKNSDVSRQVIELLVVGGGGYVYRNQAGGGGWNTGNQNQ